MTQPASKVLAAFEPSMQLVALADIHPLRLVTAAVRRTTKYRIIAASIREVGVIEPPVVFQGRPESGKYLLLDGHLRLDVLKAMEVQQVRCLIATDDEAFTFNKHVNRLVIVQEHRMIVSAIERGVPEGRIASALNIDIKTVRQKLHLLDGICPEAAELLRARHISTQAVSVLKRMQPLRQIEVADLMIAMDNYTTSYAKSLLAATTSGQLRNAGRRKPGLRISNTQTALMERESASLAAEFKAAERSYGIDHLHLVLAKGYLNRLLASARVVRYLARQHSGILSEFQKMVEAGPGLA
jgi:ParB-like chromosome segregation protein Spo0J